MDTLLTDINHLANIIVCMDNYMGSWTRYTKEQVDKDSILLFGFVKHLELIGQETAALSEVFRNVHPCKWDELEELKDIFRWDITADDLYNINRQKLPTLWIRLLEIFKEVKGNS